jgi:hypothetical protein
LTNKSAREKRRLPDFGVPAVFVALKRTYGKKEINFAYLGWGN